MRHCGGPAPVYGPGGTGRDELVERPVGDDGAELSGERPLAEGEPGYGIGAAARRLGVPAPTLRTWNLRYGIGPSRRSPGGHRRYDDEDLRRLAEMSRLIHAGVAPADAARQALRYRPPAATGTARASETAQAARPALDETPAAPPSGEGRPAGSGPDAASATGTLPAGPPSAATLARAALAMDEPTVSRGLEAALRSGGTVWTWDHLVVPVFRAIVRRQEETGAGVEIEHLFSDRLLDALAGHARRAPAPAHPRPVLLACAEEEQHTLPAYALAAALGELAVPTRVLGARTPYAALADAMRRLGPAVVFVWSQQRETGDPAPLAALPRLRPPSRLVAGGPGWHDALPPAVTRVASLREAVAAVLGSLSHRPL
ncbi:MerR family transcriptional regulator [Sphaerisporangium melleum]|uniref:MerR family transcriptional regulator n=1 Tax=Sphaerisporangium melleum TaxID=321316 RepID=A0A917VW27_9ACTN|nr:MerR family transcriptional regulator [Sphaerisporangium melleum]GGL19840.1 MerR family transcriptional regulator [Sphaerisporangium melleum]GII74905.1 MerR family transcriptional regulator [Sphaerisporangium melleum]